MQAESFTPETDEEKFAASRSKLFKVIEEFFTFPDEEIFRDLASGQFASTVSAVAQGLPYQLPEPPVLSSARYKDHEEYSSDFIRIFDVSIGGPPCPLNEGLYYDDRQKVMEELVRFYDHFDLKLNQEGHELVDHISAELDFMHFLSFKEAGALHFHKDPVPYRLAQKDFMERHLLKWFPTLLEKLRGLAPPEFFQSSCEFVHTFLAADHRHIVSLLDTRQTVG